MSGSPLTEVGGLAATRLVDRAMCSGPDPIAQGSATVLIDGLPASRLGDKSSHGGLIMGGDAEVLIGGPTVTIRVEGDEAFMADVQTALGKLLPTRSGLEWMRQMAASGHTVTITRMEKNASHCTADDKDAAQGGSGTNSTIAWNPEYAGAGPRGSSTIGLAHEMVHGLHNATGQNLDGPNDTFEGQDGESHRNEERSTVGTGGPVRQPDGTMENAPPDYSGRVPSENSFRDDLGVPRRQTYFPSSWTPDGPPW